MPITKELANIRKFESVGFTHEQAEILASHADLLMKIFAIIAGCTSIGIAVLKLL